MADVHDIVIVGGGVAGLATAIALHRIGLKSLVVEGADSLRTTGAALILWGNAWKVLDALDVAYTLRPHYTQQHRIRGCSNCTGVKRDVKLQKEGKRLEARCIERIVLLEALAKELPQDSIRFNSKVVSLHKSTNSSLITLELGDGTSLTAKMVIGCDGVNSVVARWMGVAAAKSFGRVAIRGMVTYPESHNLENIIGQFWGKGCRAGFITCTDKQVYWFVTRRSEPQDANIYGDLERVRSGALETVSDFPETIKDIIKSSPVETINLAEMKVRWVWPWEWEWEKLSRGRVTLVGDALHPMTPDLGQGACQALEDAVVLARCIGEAMRNINMSQGEEVEEQNIESCFNKYLQERRWRVSTIVSAGFVIGNVQEGCSKLMRFIRDWIFFPLFSMSYIWYFADSDCGSLPIPIGESCGRKN